MTLDTRTVRRRNPVLPQPQTSLRFGKKKKEKEKKRSNFCCLYLWENFVVKQSISKNIK